MEINVNYLAVLVTAIASMVVGFAWYSPALFGRQWMALMGLTPEKMAEAKARGMAKVYIISFIIGIITAYVLAHFINLLGVSSVGQAIEMAVWLWLGFMIPLLVGNVLWEGKPWKLFFINAGHWLVSVIIGAIILTLWM